MKQTLNLITKARIMVFLILFGCALYALTICPTNIDFELVGRGLTATLRLFAMETKSIGIGDSIAAVLAFFLMKETYLSSRKVVDRFALIASFIIAMFIIIGISFANFNDFTFIFGKKTQIPVAAVTYIGLVAILYAIFIRVFCSLDEYRLSLSSSSGESREQQSPVPKSRRFYILTFGALFIIWTLLALPFLPGSVPHDGRNMLNQYNGLMDLNLHHTLYAPLLMGTIYQLGYSAFGPTGGCLLFTLFERLLGALVFSEVVTIAWKKAGDLVWKIVFVFYALSPMWWTYFQTLDKTALFFVSFTQYCISCYNASKTENNNITDIILLMVSSMLCCMFRNDGIFMILPSLAMLLIIKWRKSALMVMSCVGTIALCLVLRIGVPAIFNIHSVNQVEPLSVPLQQVARVVATHGNDLSDRDYEVIDRVVESDDMAERYNPEWSDSIKNRFKDTNTKEWESFWSLYFRLAKQYPKEYLAAAINHVFGYTDPFYFQDHALGPYQLYNMGPLGTSDEGVVYSDYVCSDTIRDTIRELTLSIARIPLLSFIVLPGAYTCAYLLLLLYLVRIARKDLLILFVAPIICFLICCASPVNGLLRYILPIVSTLPLYCVIVFVAENSQA